jgi:uncharacterized glyoxalase superfamily protein PhnB
MARRATPMIHVPDVRATMTWYESVGFTVESTNECDGVIDWALLSFGEGRVMFTAGGKLTNDERREVDLYVNTDGVDALFARLGSALDVKKGLYDTFYGMREFIVRDPNGFWVTFGEPSAAPAATPPPSEQR